jgi:hypothetical protein
MAAAYFIGVDVLHSSVGIWSVWLILLAAILATLSWPLMAANAIIHCALAAVFLLGVRLAPDDVVSLPYLRTLLTSFILSSVTLTLLGGHYGAIARERLARLPVAAIHRAILAVLMILVVLAAMHIIVNRVVDIRTVSGFNYLTTSDLVALTGLAILARDKIRLWEFAGALLIVALALVLAGSRASLLLFLAAAGLGAAWRFGWKGVAVIILAPLALGLLAMLFQGEEVLLRRMSTLLRLATDPSLHMRLGYVSVLFEKWYQQPLCLVLPCHPKPGEYAHNLLSVIEYFGALGVVLLAACGWLIVISLNYILRQRWWPIAFYVLAALVLFRAWVSLTFPIMLGVVLLLGARRVPANSAWWSKPALLGLAIGARRPRKA